MKVDIDKLRNSLKPKLIIEKASSLLEKKAKYLVFILLLTLVGYGGFVWYNYVYNSEWSESRIQEYMKDKDRGTILKESKFNEIITEKGKRNADYQKDMSHLKDIFRLE